MRMKRCASMGILGWKAQILRLHVIVASLLPRAIR